MLSVDDSWPDFWVAVDLETKAAGSSSDSYRAFEHDVVVEWFSRHWEHIETLTDEPDLDHIRFATFDGDGLSYRFRVIALEAGGTIRLIEFKVI